MQYLGMHCINLECIWYIAEMELKIVITKHCLMYANYDRSPLCTPVELSHPVSIIFHCLNQTQDSYIKYFITTLCHVSFESVFFKYEKIQIKN